MDKQLGVVAGNILRSWLDRCWQTRRIYMCIVTRLPHASKTKLKMQIRRAGKNTK